MRGGPASWMRTLRAWMPVGLARARYVAVPVFLGLLVAAAPATGCASTGETVPSVATPTQKQRLQRQLAEQRAGRRRQLQGTIRERLAQLRAPLPSGVRVIRGELPAVIPGYEHYPGLVAGRDGHMEPDAFYNQFDNTIYDTGAPLDRAGLAHEHFHALSAQHMTDADRRRLARITGLEGRRWAKADNKPGGLTPAGEVLADYYANLSVGNDPRREWDGAYTGAPTRRRLLRFGRALERLGDRYDLPRQEAIRRELRRRRG